MNKNSETTHKLFVYGIFLDENSRKAYGMTNPKYATVKDFLTIGSYIVRAVYVPDAGLSLTGLLVDMDKDNWDELDRLEGGYDRVLIRTVSGDRAWMYVMKGTYEEAR